MKSINELVTEFGTDINNLSGLRHSMLYMMQYKPNELSIQEYMHNLLSYATKHYDGRDTSDFISKMNRVKEVYR